MIEEILELVRAGARDAAERERRARLTRAIGSAMGVADTSTTNAAIRQLPFSEFQEAVFETDKEGRLQLLMRTLAEAREAREKERKEESGEPTPPSRLESREGKMTRGCSIVGRPPCPSVARQIARPSSAECGRADRSARKRNPRSRRAVPSYR